jgi:hypothetical protein
MGNVTISIIWLILTVLFFILGRYHWSISKKIVKPFKLSERPGKNSGSVQILGVDVDQPIKDFSKGFNDYLAEQNELFTRQNRVSAVGYWLAAITSFVSMILVWLSNK